MNIGLSAQESETITELPFQLRVSGSVDAYFRSNLNGLNKYEYGQDGEIVLASPQAPATSFADAPGFAFGMANVIIDYEAEKVGFVADLVFGPRGQAAVFLSEGSSAVVNQLYMFYHINEWLRLTFGNFNTFLGYEVISPSGNFHYSTSYMFSYGPFSHTGLKADFSIGEQWSLMLAILNPSDYTEFNPSGSYSFGGQLGYTTASGSAFLNLLYGKQALLADPTFQIDLTTGWNLSKDFYLGLNSTYNTTADRGFYGVALYPKIQTSPKLAFGIRVEYFKELADDTNPALVYGSDASTFDLTLTGNYTIGSLTLKPELRLDRTDRKVFLRSDLEPTDQLSSFLLAVVYSF